MGLVFGFALPVRAAGCFAHVALPFGRRGCEAMGVESCTCCYSRHVLLLATPALRVWSKAVHCL